jgi:multiple sugar transport system permease protein/raffinose/stachyose/melibiose transport system permease protein
MLQRRLIKGILFLPVLLYTAFAAGPFLWTAIMSLRTTDEIYKSHYGLPFPAHWGKFVTAWTEFG